MEESAAVTIPRAPKSAGSKHGKKSRRAPFFGSLGALSQVFGARNALVQRELRMALRLPRAWLMMALYISVLGAWVLGQFPHDSSLTLVAESQTGLDSGAVSATQFQESAAQRGHSLFTSLLSAQALGIWLLVPALAAGALAQEREQQTLETLLLSPLSPLQIVWGKAAGVMALSSVLLLGTLPLLSLCFLLGGVSPGEVLAGYSLLLALALFYTGLGIFCAAMWAQPWKATAMAYGLAAVSVPIVLLMLGPGIVLSAVALLALCARRAARHWNAWSQSAIGRKAGFVGRGGCALGATLFAVWILARALWGGGAEMLGLLWTLLLAPYALFAARLAFEAAAEQIARPQEPPRPRREMARDIREAWRLRPAPAPVVYQKTSEGRLVQVSTTQASAEASFPASAASRADVELTYREEKFLPDGRNPIFSRDLRHGHGGRASSLARFAAWALIATQVFLIAWGTLYDPVATPVSLTRAAPLAWAQLHTIGVMVACAWLGARALAPEREAQTLVQLLPLPLAASSIIGGKIASTLFFALYTVLMGLPLLLLAPLMLWVTWSSALMIVGVLAVAAVLTAAWGVFCSWHCSSVRAALAWSLGGILFMLCAPSLAQGLWQVALPGSSGPFALPYTAGLGGTSSALNLLSPLAQTRFVLSHDASRWAYSSFAPPGLLDAGEVTRFLLPSLACNFVLAGLLVLLTSRAFRDYARQAD
jgi:ABC-type transport system involved in multi-copper enzyme maturation permease subunit